MLDPVRSYRYIGCISYLLNNSFDIVAPEEGGAAELPAEVHVQGDQELLGRAAQL